MDSVDLEPVRHAVSTQGAILERHSQTLQDIMGGFQQLNARLMEFQAVSQAASSMQGPPPPAAVSTREPWVSPLERYYGHLGKCKTFLLQCGLIFDLQPYSMTYSTEKAKIAHLIGLLEGEALEWAAVHWRRQDPVTSTYANFTREMKGWNSPPFY
uniref:DUF4939 domain-containing protein n=1 Tax=Sander lucioperca TaxID=283035 RepID=A0A8D0DAF3_SANLU